VPAFSSASSFFERMNFFNAVLAAMSASAALFFWQTLPPPKSWGFGATFGLFACYSFALRRRAKRVVVVRLKGLTWTREDFCRGWLITGDTGSGKTRSGITPLLYQVFKNEPRWGGVCIDDKGLYWETLSEMAVRFNRQNDLILLQVRPENATADWKPPHTYNLTADRGIPFSTYAKFCVDTASSLGQQGDKGFFKNQAHTHQCRTRAALRDPRGRDAGECLSFAARPTGHGRGAAGSCRHTPD
jgi:hypothetical protein